jgi:hypothetical protein
MVIYVFKTNPAACQRFFERKTRLRFSVGTGAILPFLHVWLFMLVGLVRGASLPLGRLALRGLAMILVSILGLYAGTALAQRIFAVKDTSG